MNYAEKVLKLLNNSDIRTHIDDRNEKPGKKIRDAELAKIPFMLLLERRKKLKELFQSDKQGQGDLGPQKLEDFAFG